MSAVQGTNYLKQLNDYYQPFSSENLPLTATLLVGLTTIGLIGALYLLRKPAISPRPNPHTSSPVHLESAQTSAEITSTLNAIRGKKIFNQPAGSPSKDILDENLKPYLKSGIVDKQALFRQIDKDLSRNANGKMAFTVNGEVFKRDANELYQLLKSTTGRSEREVCAVMSLLQQGIFAKTQAKALLELKIIESGFNLESTKERATQCGAYQITTIDKDISVTCWRDNFVQSIQPNNPTHSTSPHAILRTFIDFGLLEHIPSRAQEYWTITEVYKGMI